MGRIADEDVRRVRDATDLVALVSERVVLKQKGRLYWGCCPFHAEKTPSFKVDPATQLWHCFGCGLGGDVYGFLMRTDSVDFVDAVRILADRAHIEIAEEAGGMPRGRRERLISASEAAADFYHDILIKSPSAPATKAREYLTGRGFGIDVAKRWRLGYAPGRGQLSAALTSAGFSADEAIEANLALRGDRGVLRDRFYERIMFPILDLQGRAIAFGGRVIGAGEPKYLNTQDTPVFHKSENMYAIDRAKATITSSGSAIVVEGYTDVIALHEAGVTNAVATLGTALTREHVRLLGRFAKRVVYLFDGDEAGLRAADRVASEFIDVYATKESGVEQLDLLAAIIPDGLDPADFVARQGADAMRDLVEGATPILRFGIDRRLARWNRDVPEERERALADVVQLLEPIKTTETAREYVQYIAGELFADPVIVLARLQSTRPSVARRRDDAESTESGAPVGALSLTREVKVERELLGLLVRTPRLRPKAQYLLANDLLTDPISRAMAEAIATADMGLSPAALVGELERAAPGSAAALSGVSAAESSESEADAVERELTRKLKEFDLERRIAMGMSRLKHAEEFQEKQEEAEVFKSVSAMRSQLDELRSGGAIE